MKSNNSIEQKQLPKLLLVGSAMMMSLSACCLKPKPNVDDNVIVIENNSMVANPDGTFTVSKGWMIKRMEMERKLGEALNMCIEGEQE